MVKHPIQIGEEGKKHKFGIYEGDVVRIKIDRYTYTLGVVTKVLDDMYSDFDIKLVGMLGSKLIKYNPDKPHHLVKISNQNKVTEIEAGL